MLLYFGFGNGWLWLGVIVLLSFVYFVRLHEQLKYSRRLIENLIAINQQEISVQEGDFTSIADGSEFSSTRHPYSMDLDLFGKGSLFQRFNRTCTEPGKDRLAAILATPLTSIDEIEDRQAAVRELSERIDFLQEFQATGLLSPERKEDQQEVMGWLKLPTFVYGNRVLKWMLVGFPILSLSTLIHWIGSGNVALFVVATLVQWSVVGYYAKRTALFQDYIGNKRFFLEKFVGHFDLLDREAFESRLARALNEDSMQARREIARLASRARALDLRLNIFASILLNSTILYDLLCVYRLEQWREQNRDRLGEWFNAVAETDALGSLARFTFNNPAFALPELTKDRVLTAEQLGHPLIPDADRICNDVSLHEKSSIWIVTGANMSGKSTFLRAVGVNVVLALIGSTVCAKKLVCPITKVHTGMRNTDSISEHQSYFYAELKRLQGIMKCLDEGERLLILLDEILKGTNSTDKLAGSEQLIAQLASRQCFALIATHDVSLGPLQDRFDCIQNFHFEAQIEHDELLFDYRLKPGVSTGKNATFLMRKMGIIRD